MKKTNLKYKKTILTIQTSEICSLTHSFKIRGSEAVALEGMGNFDKNGSTNNSPIERWLFFLYFSPLLRLDEAEVPLLELPIGGPCMHKLKHYTVVLSRKI